MSTREIALTVPQSTIYNAKERFKVVVAGRRMGKSFLSGVELINAAIGIDEDTGEMLKSQNVVYLAPTFAMCKGIMWKWLQEYAPKEYITKSNITELSMEFVNGSVIMLKSADNYDSLRGLSLSFVVLDEVADINPEAWSLVIRPALSDQEGGALFIGSPKGTNHFYEWYVRGNAKGADNKSWKSFSYTTLQGGMVSKQEVNEARLDLTSSEFAQEYEASFEDRQRRVYPEFNDDNMGDIEDNDDIIYIGLDFNVRKQTAVCANVVGSQLRVFKTIPVVPGYTVDTVKALQEEFPGRHIVMCPDPAGSARSSKAKSGQTDHSILKGAGYGVSLPKGQLKIVDRVNQVNALVLNANGERNLLVDHSCVDLRQALMTHEYSETTEQPDKNTKDNIDDINDGLGYLINITHPIRSKQVVMIGRPGLGRIL